MKVSSQKSSHVTNENNNDGAEGKFRDSLLLRRFSREEIGKISQGLNSLASQSLPQLKENIFNFMNGIVRLGSKKPLPGFSREILNQFCGAGPLSEITFLFLFPLINSFIEDRNPVINDS